MDVLCYGGKANSCICIRKPVFVMYDIVMNVTITSVFLTVHVLRYQYYLPMNAFIVMLWVVKFLADAHI